MALITCKECKKEVSSTAKNCPHCGAKVPPPPGKIIVFLILCAIVGAWIFFQKPTVQPTQPGSSQKNSLLLNMTGGQGYSKNETQKEQPQEPTITVSAVNLAEAYNANEVAADEKYKGRKLEVSGRITDISKDIFEGATLNLYTGNEFSPVNAMLAKDQNKTAARLSKGQKIKLSCTGGGMTIGSPALHDCTIN